MAFLKESIVDLGSTIVDGIISGFQNVLEFLFVPKNLLFDDIVDIINEKFLFISQVSSIIQEFKEFDVSNDTPSFTVELFGTEYSFIDFSFFNTYRDFIHDIICAISYFFYIIWLLSEIPAILGGLTSGQYTIFRTNQYQEYLDRNNIEY